MLRQALPAGSSPARYGFSIFPLQVIRSVQPTLVELCVVLTVASDDCPLGLMQVLMT